MSIRTGQDATSEPFRVGGRRIVAAPGGLPRAALDAVLGSPVHESAVSYVGSVEEAFARARDEAADLVLLVCSASVLQQTILDAQGLPDSVQVVVRIAEQESLASGSEHAGGMWLHLRRGNASSVLAPLFRPEGQERNGKELVGDEGQTDRMRAALVRLNHEINNPLAIISGNAQLLLELARALDLDQDLVQPIRDIEEASHRMAGLLQKLAEIAGSPGPAVRAGG